MSCNDCPTPSCACPLPSCATTLILGTVSLLNTQVFIHIEKANGAEYIQEVTTSGSGVVTLDLTDPSRAFYNPYDGQYIIYVMQGGYYCDDDKLTVTSGAQTWTTVSVGFREAQGLYTTVNLEINV